MATQTIYVGKDADVDYYNQSHNNGSSSWVTIENDTGGTPEETQGLFGFDITGAPAAVCVTSVLLYLYTPYGYMTGETYEMRRIIDSWAESTVTWATAPSCTDTNKYTHPTGTGASGCWHSYEIVNLYKDAKDAGNELGVWINITSLGKRTIASKEYTPSTYKAYIVVTSSVPTDYYVKTSGNDALTGDSWANAWATANKAATTVPDGSTVHIEHGTYNAEPAGNKIAPQNAGASGIGYKPEIVGGGAGTCWVKIEKN